MPHDTTTDDATYLARAMAAYYRTEAATHQGAQPPSPDRSHVVMLAGKAYAVLAHERGIVAIYRIKNEGILKRLKRWPDAIHSVDCSSQWKEDAHG